MAGLTAAEQKRLNRSLGHAPRVLQVAERLQNLDTDGTYLGTIAATADDLSGTTASGFTVNIGSGKPRIGLSSPDTGTGDFLSVLVPPATSASAKTWTMPDTTGNVVVDSATQTLTNKTIGASTFTGTITGRAITIGTGEYNIDMSASTGTFDTPTGDNTINGDVTLATDIDVTAEAGTSAFDLSLATGAFLFPSGQCTLGGAVVSQGTLTFNLSASTGAFTTSSGTNTLSGNTVIAGSKTFATGTGTVTINGATTIAAAVNLACEAGTTAIDLSLGTGAFTTTSGTNTLSGNVVVAGTKTFTTGTGAVTVKGATTFDAGLDIAFAGSGDGTFDLSTQTGVFKTSTGVNTISGTVSLAANKDIACLTGTTAIDLSLGTGTFKTTTGAHTLGGSVTIADAATPSLTTAAGKTNTGFVQVNGKTSGAIKLMAADAAVSTTTLISGAPAGNVSVTLPVVTGQLGFVIGGGTTKDGTDAAMPITHSYVAASSDADGSAWSLANGKPGQKITIKLVVDGGGDGTLTVTTSTSVATIVFADAGDTAVLEYVDNTVGWTIVSLFGLTAQPAYTSPA